MIDQFETESSQIYSGSYTDSVVVPSPQGGANGNTLGVRFASRVGGVVKASESVNVLYNQRLSLVSGSAIGSRTRLRFTIAQTDNEFFYDSFVPSPASIANINGKSAPFLSFSLGNQQMESSLIDVPEFNRPGQSERVAHVFFPGESPGKQFGNYDPTSPIKADQFIDFDWITSPYPFQTKYKNLPRVLRPDSRYPTEVSVSKDPTGAAISDPFSTSDIGSMFITLADNVGLFNPIGQWSQIWEITGSKAISSTATRFNHVFVKSYNGLANIYWNNIPGTDSEDLYIAVGNNGTILKSFDGLKWELVSSDRLTGPAHLPMVISSYPFALQPTIRDLVGTGVLSSFRRYILACDEGIIVGPLLTKTPLRTNWTWIDLPSQIGAAFVQLKAIAYNNDGGNLPLGNARICAVGEQISPTQGAIISSDQDGIVWGAASGFALDADPWWDVVWVGGPSNKWFAVGENGLGSPPPGVVGRSPSSSGLGSWVNITPTGSVNRLLSVDWNPTSDTLIAVGDSGGIWRTPNPADSGGGSWAQITPANGYSGRFNTIKYVHFSSAGTGKWIATGESGEIQVSSDDGLTWQKAEIELPAVPLSVFSFPKTGESSPIELFAGRPNFSILSEAPRHLIVAGSVIDELDELGDYFITFLRVADANFNNFTDRINDAVLNKKNEFVSGAQLPKPLVGDIFKTFFGFGNGLSLPLEDTAFGETINVGKAFQAINFREISFYDLYKRDGRFGFGQIRLHGPLIRGWRYGIYNGIPTRTTAIFRQGRYGQFRDLLEPRKYTKFLSTTNNVTTTDAAVVISFVSGTDVAASASLYAAATSDVSFNPFDSGIYDTQYRSGRPYSDNR